MALPRGPHVLAALAGAVLLAGCSSSGGTTSAGSTSQAPSRPASAAPPAPSSGAPSAVAATGDDWPQYHLDAARSGAAVRGPDPRAAGVAWRSGALDGAVYAEPLVDGGRVVAATEGGSLYGLDLGDGHQLWRRHVADPVTGGLPCGDITPLGITGTPVVDSAAHTVFAVAEKPDSEHLLAAVDDRTGEFLWERVIDPPGSDPLFQQQRAALALDRGRVVVAFGGRFGDCGDYHGWVVSVQEDGGGDLLSYMVPTAREGGIWAPSGPAVDAAGSIYVSTGNGISQTSFDHGNAVIRLDPSLREQDVYGERAFARHNATDTDLGSTGPLLLPGGLLLVAGKDGRVEVLRQGHLGGVGGALSSTPVGGPAYGGFAASGGVVDVPCSDGLRAIRVGSDGSVQQLWKSVPTEAPILAGGALWAVALGGTRLLALDPATGARISAFDIGAAPRFATPAASAGTVLVGTRDGVVAVR